MLRKSLPFIAAALSVISITLVVRDLLEPRHNKHQTTLDTSGQIFIPSATRWCDVYDANMVEAQLGYDSEADLPPIHVLGPSATVKSRDGAGAVSGLKLLEFGEHGVQAYGQGYYWRLPRATFDRLWSSDGYVAGADLLIKFSGASREFDELLLQDAQLTAVRSAHVRTDYCSFVEGVFVARGVRAKLTGETEWVDPQTRELLDRPKH